MTQVQDSSIEYMGSFMWHEEQGKCPMCRLSQFPVFPYISSSETACPQILVSYLFPLLMFLVELVGVQGARPSFQACRFPYSLELAECP